MEFLKFTLEPNDSKIFIINFISERLGIFDITISSSINNEDARIGKEEFFAPLILIVLAVTSALVKAMPAAFAGISAMVSGFRSGGGCSDF